MVRCNQSYISGLVVMYAFTHTHKIQETKGSQNSACIQPTTYAICSQCKITTIVMLSAPQTLPGCSNGKHCASSHSYLGCLHHYPRTHQCMDLFPILFRVVDYAKPRRRTGCLFSMQASRYTNQQDDLNRIFVHHPSCCFGITLHGYNRTPQT